MASYKVPQDVEADDKLLGPFSFRQFVYLIIVAMAIAMAWGLAQLFVGLAIIPLPIIIFFGALALPLRKDQPMEIYMAAIVSFYIKPRLRLWDPDGIESSIEVSAPKTVEEQRTKDISETEAERRFSYLADIVDTQGWAIRGAANSAGSPINTDLYLEAQEAPDVLDTNTSMAHTFDQMMAQSTEKMKEEARRRMFQPVTQPTPSPLIVPAAQPTYYPPAPETPGIIAPQQPAASLPQASPYSPQLPPNTQAASQENNIQQPLYNPYPSFNQSVLQPLDETYRTTPIEPTPVPHQDEPALKQENSSSTSDTAVSADIINLANNSEDLSIETIAHEANRLKERAKKDSDEVIISLR